MVKIDGHVVVSFPTDTDVCLTDRQNLCAPTK